MSRMTVIVDQIIELDEATVDKVFTQRLEELTEGRWVRDNKLMEEQYTSHRFDAEVGGPEHPDFSLVATIQYLQTLLKERKKKQERRRRTTDRRQK